MKVTTKDYENGQAIMQIEVEPDELAHGRDEAYREVAKKVNIPGFRKGKAPRHVVENYIGAEGLTQQALEHLIPELCNKAAQEESLDLIAQPQAEILEYDPVVFKAIFPLRPKVEPGDYRSIRLAPEPVEVTDDTVNSIIDSVRENNAVWEPVERPAAFGDMVVMNIEQRMGDREPIMYNDQQLPIVEGSPLPVPGFSEQIVGLEKDQDKDFTISFPEDHEIKRLAGTTYDFKVKVLEIKQKRLPELNDEFVASLGLDVNTVDELKAKVSENARKMAEERAHRAHEQKVVQAAVDLAKVEYPPVLLDRETDYLLREQDLLMRSQGGIEAYLRNMNKTEEQIREEIKPRAVERLVQTLVLDKIAEEEKIEVTAAEIDAQVEKEAAAAEEDLTGYLSMLKTPQGRRMLSDELRTRKAVEKLVEIATESAEKPEASVEEQQAPAEETVEVEEGKTE